MCVCVHAQYLEFIYKMYGEKIIPMIINHAGLTFSYMKPNNHYFLKGSFSVIVMMHIKDTTWDVNSLEMHTLTSVL